MVQYMLVEEVLACCSRWINWGDSSDEIVKKRDFVSRNYNTLNSPVSLIYYLLYLLDSPTSQGP